MNRSVSAPVALRLRQLAAVVLVTGLASAAGSCAPPDEERSVDPDRVVAPRAVVRSGILSAASGRSVTEIASDYLASNDRGSLRSSSRADLELVGERKGVVRFAQRHRGLRVVGGGASVRVDERGQIRWTRTRLVSVPSDLAAQPVTEPPAQDAELVIFAPTWAPPRLAWQVDSAFDGASAPRTYTDAETGDTLHAEDQVLYEGQAWAYDQNPIVSTLEQVTLDHLPPGSGVLRDDDLEVMTCIDRSECAELSSEGAPSLFIQRCSPEHLAVADANGDFLAYEEPEDDRAVDDPFAEVQVYHHLSRAMAWFRSLGLDELRTRPTMVLTNYRPEGRQCDDATAEEALRIYYDNAFFSPAGTAWQPGSRDMLAFGNGRRADLGWDGDVATHELAHAVMHTVGDLGRSVKDDLGIDHSPGGMHEGFADYFAAAFAGDPDMAEWFGWHEFYGVPLRDLAIDSTCYDVTLGYIPEPHAVGNTLAAALWRIRDGLAADERPGMDRAMFRVISAFDRFDDFTTARDLVIAEVAAELGDDAAASAREILDQRRIGDCNRVFALDHEGEGEIPDVIAFPAEAGRPTPTTTQWRLELFERTPELSVWINGNCEAASAILKPGAEPIRWDWTGAEGRHDAAMSTELRDEPVWGQTWAIFPGPLEPGVYHLQLLNHGARTCILGADHVVDERLDSGSDGPCDLEQPALDIDCYDSFCSEEGADVDCDGVCHWELFFDLDCQDGECDEGDLECVPLPGQPDDPQARAAASGRAPAAPIAAETLALRHLQAVAGATERVALPRRGNVVRFARTHRGVPVVGGDAAVRIDDQGRVGWWRERVPEVPDDLVTTPTLTADEAVSRAGDLVGRTTTAGARPELVVFAPPGVPARLAWRVAFPAEAEGQAVRAPIAVVDAATGAVIDLADAIRADRRGLAYDPDPLTPVTEVVLESLPPGADVLRDPDLDVRTCVDDLTCSRLDGPNGPAWLHLCSLDHRAEADAAGDFLFDPPASGLAEDDPFTEVQLYHQLSAGLRWFRSIGFGALLHEPILAIANYRQENVLCAGEDAGTAMPRHYPFSFFSPTGLVGHPGSEHALVFGTRQDEGTAIPLADWAWESDIVHHELGHAVLHSVGQPGDLVRDELGVDITPAAVQEGLADYFAAAMTNDPQLAEWTAALDNGPGSTMRDLDNDHRCYTQLGFSPGFYFLDGVGERHSAGLILGGALWEIRQSLGEEDRPRLDAAVLEAAGGLDPFDGFTEVTQLLVDELELALGAEIAAAASAVFEDRGLAECDRVLPMAPTMETIASTYIPPAPPGGRMPSTIQWTFEVTEEVPRLTFDWRNDCALQAPSEVYLKSGGEPIQWTWDGTTGTNDASCFAAQPDGQNITLPGPFAPGTYVIQIGNRGSTECITTPYSLTYSIDPPPAPYDFHCDVENAATDPDCYDYRCSGTEGDPDCDGRCVFPDSDSDCEPGDPGEEVPGVTGGPCPPPDEGGDDDDGTADDGTADDGAGDDGIGDVADDGEDGEDGEPGGCGCGAAGGTITGPSEAALHILVALGLLGVLRPRRSTRVSRR